MTNPSGPPTALDSLLVGGVPTMGLNGIPLTTGNVFFVDYVNGSDGNTGAANNPFKTVYWAYGKCVSGNGDVVAVISNGAASGSQRLSVANAQVATPSATAGTLLWAKNNTHLVGICSPTRMSQRARFAPPTGTYTVTTFGSATFVNVTGTGCIFSNLSVYQGFSTGGAAQICWLENGGRNYYNNVSFLGMNDASATDAGSRALKISGVGENTFVGCIIGDDTTDRTVANASLEFASGTPRNTFIDCIFPMRATAATVLSILGTGATCMDRWQDFERCRFFNAMSSGATAQTVIASLTSASPGGYMAMVDCTFVGDTNTNWGDTNALANMYIDGAAPTAATSGNAVKPT